MKEQLLKLQEVFAKAKGERVELGLIDDFEKQFEKALKDNTADPMFKLYSPFLSSKLPISVLLSFKLSAKYSSIPIEDIGVIPS